MDNKRGTVPGYGRGRGRAVWRNNYDSTVNRPIGHIPREWHQRFGHSVCGRGQQAFAAMFNGDATVSHFFTSAKSNNSSVGYSGRRGNLSWADIRQQSQWNGFEMRTAEANTFQLDKSHYFHYRPGFTDGPWGGRGRGILEKVSSDEESSSHSNEKNIWGGRGRGSILGAPKISFESKNFRCSSGAVEQENKPHRGQFRGGHVKNQNIYATNKREQIPNKMALPVPNKMALPVPNKMTMPVPNKMAMPMPYKMAMPVPNKMAKQVPISMPMTYPLPLPFMFQNLDLNFTSSQQERNKPKKKQQQRKNWHKGRMAGSSGKDVSGKSTKNVGKNSSQSSLSLESEKNDVETQTKKDGQKSVLPNTKRLVIINGPVESGVKMQDKTHSSKVNYQSDGINGKLINRVNDTLSNEQQNFAEQPSECINKSHMLIRESTIVKDGDTAGEVVKPLSEIINPCTDNSKSEQKSDQI